MELTVTLNRGALDAEFTGEDREEIEENLLKFVQFIEDNEQAFNGAGLSIKETDEEDRNEPGLDAEYWEKQSPNEPTESERETTEDHPLAPIARKAGTSVDALDEIIYVDSEGEELPQLMIEQNKLGDSVAGRQRTAAYLILQVWDECYGESRMKTSQLKEILTMSGVSDNNLYNAWGGSGKGDFDTSGKGASATVALTGPGKRRAIKRLKELTEDSSE